MSEGKKVNEESGMSAAPQGAMSSSDMQDIWNTGVSARHMNQKSNVFKKKKVYAMGSDVMRRKFDQK